MNKKELIKKIDEIQLSCINGKEFDDSKFAKEVLELVYKETIN